MNIITIGTDIHILDNTSRAYKRIKEYSFLVDAYTVFVFSASKKQVLIDHNLKIIPVYGKNKLVQMYRFFSMFKKEVLNKKEDIVLSSQDPFEIGLLCFFVAKFFRLRLHIQVHTEFFSPFFKKQSLRNRYQAVIAPFVLRRAQSIRVVSKKIADFLTHVLRLKSSVIVAPIYIEPIDSFSNLKDKNLVVAVSRLEKEKNFFRLIKTFEIVALKQPELRLEIYGEGSQREKILKLINKSVIKERVTLFSFLLNPFEVMSKASAFIISSDFEGYAVTAVESVMSGTPVCMTPVGCAGEFIVNNVNGFVSSNFSIGQLAIALEQTLTFDFDPIILKKSLQNLLTKDEYYRLVILSWEKTL